MEAADTSLPPPSDAPTVDALIGWRTESLHFESCLGRGAMGAVYRGTQIRLDRKVAIKVISEHLSANKDYVDRFNREAKTLAKLAHPNVVTCYDFGPIIGPNGRTLLVLVMEFVDGVSLSGFTREGASVKTLLDLYRQAADGLAAAHAIGVLHRDIKPDNIMITHGGVAKLADFGLAKGLEGSVLTMTGTIMGTPAYMAPEICKGGEPLPASDVYSLGCSLFDSLAGLPPFRSGSALEVIQLHITQEPPTLSDFVPQVSQLDTLMQRVLDKTPAHRPSARDLATQLGKWRDLSSPGIKVGPGGLDGQRQRADLHTMANEVSLQIASAEEVEIPDAQSARQLPGTDAPMRAGAAAADGGMLRDVDLGLDRHPSAGPERTSPETVPLPSRGTFQVPDYLLPVPATTGAAGTAPPSQGERSGTLEPPSVPPALPSPALPPVQGPPAPLGVITPEHPASTGPQATPSLPPPAPTGATAPVRAPRTAAPDADNRDQLHVAAVSRRIAEAKQCEEQGDAALRARRVPAALQAFNQALKLVTSGPAKATLIAKLGRARQVQLQQRVMWGTVGCVVVGILAALGYRYLPTPSAPEATPSGETVVAAAAKDPLKVVLDRYKDVTVDPHALLQQLRAIQPSLDPHDPRVSDLQERLNAQIRDFDQKLAEVERCEHTDPAQALAKAEALRKEFTYASWFVRQLPLPGRLVVRGANLPLVTISDGGVTRRASDGLIFCRFATTATSLVVSGNGYQAITQEVPADPSPSEQVYPIDMQDRPEWTVPITGSNWAALAVDGDDDIQLSASALRVIGSDGAISAQLLPGHLHAEAKAFLPITGLLTLPVHVCTDDGGCWEITIAHHQVSRARLVHQGAPLLSFCEQSLTYHVGDLGVFAIQLGEDGAFELALSSHDHDLWTRSLGGKLAPALSQLHETVSVIDENALTVFDQEGNRVTSTAIGAQRIGPVYEATAGGGAHRVVFTTTTGPRLFQQQEDGWHGVPASTLEGLGQGLLASAGGAILSCLADDVIYLPTPTAGERWIARLTLDRSALWASLTTSCALVGDDKNQLSVFSTRSGNLMRTVILPAALLCPPQLGGNLLLVTTTAGTQAYTLHDATSHAPQGPLVP